jgi:hypothetical protein
MKKPNDTNMVKEVTYLYAFGQSGMSTHFTKVSLYANVIIILLLEVPKSFWTRGSQPSSSTNTTVVYFHQGAQA